MAKLDKRLKYQNDDEKPVTISMRLPKDLHTRLEQYATQHRQSISELVRDGLEWRLSEGDPRGLGAASTKDEETYYMSNTENVLADMRQALAQQEAQIQAIVQALERQATLLSNGAHDSNTAIERAKQAYLAGQKPESDTASIDTTPLTPAAGAAAETAHEGNTVIQPAQPKRRAREVRANGLQAAQTPALARGEAPSFDTTRYYLGKLCPKGHEFDGTGLSLLRKHNQSCRTCENEGKQARRQARRQALEAPSA